MKLHRKSPAILRIVLQILTVGFLTSAGSCTHDQYQEVNDVQMLLQPLGKTLAVHWPTNCSKQVGVLHTYRAQLDGGSENTETIARLEMVPSVYLSWYQGATKLKEWKEFGAIEEPRLTERFPWWEPHNHAEPNVTLFFREIDEGPDYRATMKILIVLLTVCLQIGAVFPCAVAL